MKKETIVFYDKRFNAVSLVGSIKNIRVCIKCVRFMILVEERSRTMHDHRYDGTTQGVV